MTDTTDYESAVDELAKRRIVSEGAKQLKEAAYSAAALFQGARRQGASIETILTEIENHLEPREAGRLKAGLVDILGPLLSFMVPLLEGADPREAFSACAGIPSVKDDPMFARAFAKMESAMDRVANSPPERMKAVIKRLFKEAESPLPDQAPALECWILLHGLPTSIHGSLSETPEGELRMLSPAPQDNRLGGSVMMIEQFFCYNDVMSIAVVRPVDVVDEPRIIRS